MYSIIKKLYIPILTCMHISLHPMHTLTTPEPAYATDPIAPTVLVHGLNCTPHDMQPLANHIAEISPNTPLLSIQLPEKGFCSLTQQATEIKEQVRAAGLFQTGCNIIAHSMGGLAARLAMENGDLPPVLTCCSLGTPHRGVDHLPANSDTIIDAILYRYWKIHPFESLESKLARLACLHIVQDRLSIANIWHDPAQEQSYQACMLLAKINNETEHPDAQRYRENMQKIGRLVSIAGLYEYMVEPTVSTHWSYYRINQQGKKELEPIQESPMYTALGLDTLEKRNAFRIIGVCATHAGLRTNKNIFLEHIAPTLARESEKHKVTEQAHN